jgi:type 1 glutamine amidotransferase
MRTMRCLSLVLVVALLGASPGFAATTSKLEKKKIVFVTRKSDHGRGEHEYYAGSLLLANALRLAKPGYTIEILRSGWPNDDAIFDGADAIVIYADGGADHPIIPYQDNFAELAKRGVGLACLHYAVEVPKGKTGNYFLEWIGGYFETSWSVNPVWNAEFTELPRHPITRGVKPFSLNDEWYYHMRFRDDMRGVAPILRATPPASTLNREDGSHSGNPYVRAEIGRPQHLAWAANRSDGGRGFGVTGGHFHNNWASDDFRRIVLNAIVWVAKGTVPEDGIKSATPTEVDMEANLEPKP